MDSRELCVYHYSRSLVVKVKPMVDYTVQISSGDNRRRSSVDISAPASKKKMNSLPRPSAGERKRKPPIGRVFPHLRKQDDEAYNPKFVSIGPLHHGKREFQPVEDLKWMNLEDLLIRSRTHTFSIFKTRYFRKIYRCLTEAREAYSGKVKLSDKEFAKMLVVDGCFLVEMIIQRAYPAVDSKTFYFRSRADFGFLRRDLLLPENQIPFFVLNILFKEIKVLYSHLREGGNSENLVSLALRFLGISLPPGKHPGAEEVLHLLHLRRLTRNLTSLEMAQRENLPVPPTSGYSKTLPRKDVAEPPGTAFRVRRPRARS